VKEADPALDGRNQASWTPPSPRWKRSRRAPMTGEAYDQQIGEGNAEGNAVVQAAIDALVDQTKSIERACSA
jgi:putative iron-regulated protein